MVDFAALFAANPPDPNEPLPLANKPTTVYGTTLPFHVSDELLPLQPKVSL